MTQLRKARCAQNQHLVTTLKAIADSKQNEENSRLATTYKRAVQSICKYPLPIHSYEDAKQLDGIGDFLARRIERIIQQNPELYQGTKEDDSDQKSAEDIVEPRSSPVNEVVSVSSSSISIRKTHLTSVTSSSTLPHSSPVSFEWADDDQEIIDINGPKPSVNAPSILASSPNFNLNSIVLEAIIPIPSIPLVVSQSFSSSFQELSSSKLSKELLVKPKKKTAFQRSNSNRSIIISPTATEIEPLVESKNSVTGSNDNEHSQLIDISESYSEDYTDVNSIQDAENNFEAKPEPPLRILKEGYEVILLIDNRERPSHSHLSITSHLQKIASFIKFEIRPLSIGDFMWIARDTSTQEEYVLNAVIERKRVNDFVLSIRDNRFKEQRWRLKNTEIERKIYIIEGQLPKLGSPGQTTQDVRNGLGLPTKTLHSAILGLVYTHHFHVQIIPNFNLTLQFLVDLHVHLTSECQSNGIAIRSKGIGESFASFQQRLKKTTQPVDKLFTIQLRVIKGVSPAVATAIANRHPTIRSLLSAYTNCKDLQSARELLADITFGHSSRHVGPALSSRVHDFFRSLDYDRPEAQVSTTDMATHGISSSASSKKRSHMEENEPKSFLLLPCKKRVVIEDEQAHFDNKIMLPAIQKRKEIEMIDIE